MKSFFISASCQGKAIILNQLDVLTKTKIEIKSHQITVYRQAYTQKVIKIQNKKMTKITFNSLI